MRLVPLTQLGSEWVAWKARFYSGMWLVGPLMAVDSSVTSASFVIDFPATPTSLSFSFEGEWALEVNIACCAEAFAASSAAVAVAEVEPVSSGESSAGSLLAIFGKYFADLAAPCDELVVVMAGPGTAGSEMPPAAFAGRCCPRAGCLAQDSASQCAEEAAGRCSGAGSSCGSCRGDGWGSTAGGLNSWCGCCCSGPLAEVGGGPLVGSDSC